MIDLRVNHRMSLSEIADRVGLDRSTVADHVKDYPLAVDEAKEIHRKKVKGRKYIRIDLTGQKFHRLTVQCVDYSPSKKNDTRWACKCDCGKDTVVTSHNLRAGIVKSCGCLATELKKQRNQKDPQTVNLNYMIHKYRWAAKQRDIQFALTDEECATLFQGACYYCGVPPSNAVQYHGNLDGPRKDFVFICNGIDRIDSSGGYTCDNCVSCCTRCNYAKRDSSLEEFMTWIERLCAFWSKEPEK